MTAELRAELLRRSSRPEGGWVRRESARFPLAVGLLRQFGLRVSVCEDIPKHLYAPSSDPGWQADVVAYRNDDDYEPSGTILHELGHFQVAPPHRRRLPDYGLGAFSYSAVSGRRRVSRSRVDGEEYLASVMGGIWAEHLEFRSLASELDHLGRPGSGEELGAALLTLHRWRLIDRARVPQIRCRPPRGGHPPLTAHRIRFHMGACPVIRVGNAWGLWRSGAALVWARAEGKTLEVAWMRADSRVQRTGLEELLAEEERGPFVPLDRDERLIHDTYPTEEPTP